MSQNVQNIQTSLSIQQTYSSTLCTHINNIYNKLSELQKHIQHHCMYPHQTNTVQINALDDPDIDGDNQPNTDNKCVTVSVQGTINTSQEPSVLKDDNSIAPDNFTIPQSQQETDWLDTPTIQILGISSTTLDQPPEVMYNRRQIQPSTVDLEISELEEDSDQDQFTDLDTFITHHNTHQESEWIQQEYFAKRCQDHHKQTLHDDPQRNLNNYSEKAEAKPDTENSIITDHSATKCAHWRVVYNGKLRKTNVCVKSIPQIINILPLHEHYASVTPCQVHIKGF